MVIVITKKGKNIEPCFNVTTSTPLSTSIEIKKPSKEFKIEDSNEVLKFGTLLLHFSQSFNNQRHGVQTKKEVELTLQMTFNQWFKKQSCRAWKEVVQCQASADLWLWVRQLKIMRNRGEMAKESGGLRQTFYREGLGT